MLPTSCVRIDKQAITFKRRKQEELSLFLDLSKVFDMLNHTILLQKLELYGIHGSQLDWFKSYLQKRKLTAKITTPTNEVEYSDTYDITYRAAQGSCLGLLLFIFCNDIHVLPLIGTLILFMDDTTTLLNSSTRIFNVT